MTNIQSLNNTIIRELVVGITSLLFLESVVNLVRNFSNFDKVLIINLGLAYSNNKTKMTIWPPTVEAAWLVQQRTHTLITYPSSSFHNLTQTQDPQTKHFHIAP